METLADAEARSLRYHRKMQWYYDQLIKEGGPVYATPEAMNNAYDKADYHRRTVEHLESIETARLED